MKLITSPVCHDDDEFNSSVVVVVLVPTGPENPPPLLSFIAEHEGGLSGGTEKLSVHAEPIGAPAAGAPSVTLPAESDPTMAAPVPQSGPSAGEAANEEAADHSITTVPAMSAVSTLPLLDKCHRMIY